ncbi:MAG TPA: patatin-like phospholipase family protein [Candidatus Nitrosocosmicus sp.]|nr:patatin-like phospholipase family protein [Candidatus Nitrosocosmicus sp.]
MKRKIPKSERILVFQGGGSLGAYEAGAYRGIYELLKKSDDNNSSNEKPVFDIIAGSSIGAINSAILTSHVVETGSYEGSAEKLIEFWYYLSKESMTEKNPYFKGWWNYLHSINDNIASGEAARRYYSSKEFSYLGVPNVFVPMVPHYDKKFFDIQNTWYRFDIAPLKRSLEKFANFPIKTKWEESQPRLLLVSVDVATSHQVVFDSYERNDGSRYSEYGTYIRKGDHEVQHEYVIRYDEGITSDHVIASAAYPVNFDYVSLSVEKYDLFADKNAKVVDPSGSPLQTNKYKIQQRKFWDGGLMNNTPLIIAISRHREYWYHVRGVTNEIPSLAIAIVNLHPSAQDHVPTDRDGVINRNNDISFSDRSTRDEAYLLVISDYLELIKRLLELLKNKGVEPEMINSILDQKIRSHSMLSKLRTFRNLIEGPFNITDIIRIERKNDENTISSKTYDFSKGTINQLLIEGYNDSLSYLQKYFDIQYPQK